ncbi:hypothetical protein BDA99DRAFT_570099 [Phascolomyces articulosus]|uniref:F-box domain-containing protein n=1 Tax=Phascolomyces articulosus TaxID=60185 RepID=A0AAD5K4K3_9FUNG|nr:hypothetical protein BDA99DRAFT_570099 [Phascolomyces articulosus]
MLHAINDDNSFLTKFPYEIINHIIAQLSLHNRLQCTQVCKTWRSLLLSSSSMWADISSCSNIARNLAQYEINGKDIQKVKLLEDNPNDAEFLLQKQASSIRSLIIAYRESTQNALLSMTGHALTDLEIMMIAQLTTEACYSMIFNFCPNLTRLEIHYFTTNAQLVDYSNPSQVPSNKTIKMDNEATEAMKRLKILYISQPLPMKQTLFKELVSYFTGLKHLYIEGIYSDGSNDHYQGILDWVDDTFPLLQTVWFMRPPRRAHIDSSMIHRVNFRTGVIYGKHGRKSFAYNCGTIHPNSVDRFLKKHASIIDVFQTTVDYSSKTTFSAMQRFINQDLVTAAYHLRSLIIENFAGRILVPGMNLAFPKFDLDPVLSHFPSLEQLTLLRINLKDTTTTTSSSKENIESKGRNYYRSLKAVEFDYCKGLSRNTLMTCINRFQQKMDYVRFKGLDDLLDDALDAMAENVQSLGQLEFGQKELDCNTVFRTTDAWLNKSLSSLRLYLYPFEIESHDDDILYAEQNLKNTVVDHPPLIVYDREYW